ncbi:hypothetical protein [Spiroplasma alleghenense]|uniref:Lipoprotein n=1 Tax=Spiroplasma alleghenense TaxID=216931 RepID=A0A345Z569_9MOLU|nr:hypothetical protein [Spiroplasma alleghenense]AXK51748.1 hypothetical protein SALLE_v1c10780 [Spiroplasma alleghenense]
MKKLLTILATATMVVASPLSVIACGKKMPPVADEFDFAKLINDFIANVTTIFKSDIAQKFDEYKFVMQDVLPTELDLQIIKNAQEEFDNHDGKVYEETKAWISDLIPRDIINKSIKDDVLSNINYNSILIDKNSPLKSGIEVEEVALKVQSSAITFNIKISSAIYLKDESEEKIIEPISTFVDINIFDEEEILQKAQEVNDEFHDLINKKIANQITFLSDSGNTNQNAIDITEDDQIINFLKSEAKSLQTADVKIIDQSMKLKTVQNALVHAGTGVYYNSFMDNNNKEPYNTFISALKGNKEAEKTLLENISGNNGEWLTIEEDETIEELSEATQAIENGAKISLGLNQYALHYNFSISTILEKLKSSSGSQFEVDKEKDANMISVYGYYLNGLKFSLADSEFAFSDGTIFVKQEISNLNTLDYYNDFIKDSWNFQKNFLSISWDDSKPDEYLFNLQAAQNWKKEELAGKLFNYSSFPWAELVKANSKANVHNQRFNFSPIIAARNGTNWITLQTNVYISDDFDIFIWNNNNGKGAGINISTLFTSMFPDLINHPGQPNLDFQRFNRGNPGSFDAENYKEYLSSQTSVLKLKFTN